MTTQSRGGGSVKVTDVSKSYRTEGTLDVQAIRGCSFDVEPGEFVTIIGPSGCGKSTVLKIIAGLTPSTAGTVEVDGKLATRPDRDRGMVFQDYALLPWKTVRKNVELGLRINGVPAAERRERSSGWLDKVGLARFADRYPRELSGGMKQRVAVARALANEPGVLLMDEPFAAVDELTRQRLQVELARISEQTTTTIIFVTHSVDEAVFLSDRVIRMGGHPAMVEEAVTVDIPRPRTWESILQNERYEIIRKHLSLKLMSSPEETAQNAYV